ncbi:MAG: sulfite exporter TauE/SafE family protein [Candidatus Pelagadaptatus aseana]
MDILMDQLPFLMPFVSAFLVGLLGGMHCIGMCGGIMAALSFSIPEAERGKRWRILLSYNIGRIASYGLIGLLAGLLSLQLSGGHDLSAMRVIAGLLLIAMGLYLAGWWQGLTYLEKLGGLLWRYVQPLGKRLMPVKNTGQGMLLGMIWGWLPCGLVYTALAYGMAQGNPAGSMGVMLAFGLGTLPTVLASGLFAEKLKHIIQKKALRTFMALLIIAFGVWTIWVPYNHSKMDHGSMDHENMDHGSMDHSQMNHHNHH